MSDRVTAQRLPTSCRSIAIRDASGQNDTFRPPRQSKAYPGLPGPLSGGARPQRPAVSERPIGKPARQMPKPSLLVPIRSFVA